MSPQPHTEQQTPVPGSCAVGDPESVATVSRVDEQAPSASTLAPPGMRREGEKSTGGGECGGGGITSEEQWHPNNQRVWVLV